MDFGEDRISNLPDEIFLHIISYLSCKDIVATFLSSTRWKSVITFLPFPDLEYCEVPTDHRFNHWRDYSPKLISAQEWIRDQIPDGGRIRKYGIKYPARYDFEKKLLSTLISQVVRHKVEEFDLHVVYFSNPKPMSLHSLLTCDSLTSLKLTMQHHHDFPSSISLPCLKTLHLKSIKWTEEQYAQQLISRCPVLEDLLLYYELMDNPRSFEGQHGIYIDSATLKRLTVEAADGHLHSSYCHLRISSSSLQFLKLSCANFELVHPNLISISEADLDIVPYERYHVPYGNPDEHRVLKLLEKICHVKLSHSTLRFNSESNVDHYPTFHNLTHLEVGCGGLCLNNNSGIVELMNILQKSPNLESLNFPQGIYFNNFKELFSENVVPLSCLKTFSFSCFQGSQEEVCFLRYILENADGLKHFTVYWWSATEREIWIEEELRTLSRSACVNFLLDSDSDSDLDSDPDLDSDSDLRVGIEEELSTLSSDSDYVNFFSD